MERDLIMNMAALVIGGAWSGLFVYQAKATAALWRECRVTRPSSRD